jgi:hypothetical protein
MVRYVGAMHYVFRLDGGGCGLVSLALTFISEYRELPL